MLCYSVKGQVNNEKKNTDLGRRSCTFRSVATATLSHKRLMISLLIMECRKHSSYLIKLFIPWDECFLHFIINNQIIHGFWDSVRDTPDNGLSTRHIQAINAIV
jgi:hypothetical protein